MTEASNLLIRLKGSKRVYLRHMKNMERSILDEIGTFSCENEEEITKLTGLKNGLLEKIDKVKEIDQSKTTWYFTTGRVGKRAREYFSFRRPKFWVIMFEKKHHLHDH